jgi:hypothetical protein
MVAALIMSDLIVPHPDAVKIFSDRPPAFQYAAAALG